MSDTAKPLRVLLIEDSENDAILLLRELKRGGYEPIYRRVDTPEAVKAALRDAEDGGEPWDIIISDYYMPRFRGPEALAIARELGYDTPFIVVSGKVGEDLAVEILKAGAQDYVTKENMARLNPAIERELREAQVRRDRLRAQEALDRSEERFRRLVEQAADAMFVHDLEGRFVDVNRRACESLGYTREELLEMYVPDVEKEYKPGSLEKLWREVSTGIQRTLDGTHLRKDGTTFPVEIRLSLFESDGTPLMLATARDVTERKKAEDELRESEERFRATFEQAAVGILQVGLDAAWIRVNDRFCEIVGYTREELREISVFDFIPPEDFGADFDRGTRMLAGEFRDYTEEKRIVGKDRRNIWVNLTVSLVHDASDTPRYFIAIVEDISQRRRAEEDLRLRDRAIAASSNGIVISDPNQPDDPIIYVNASFERITGYSSKEVIGKNCRFLQGEDREQPALEELRAAIREQRDCTVVLRNYRKDGSFFWNELTISPVRDERGRLTHFIGVQNDVSDRMRAEEAVRESERRFRSLVQNASDIIIILDPDGTVRYESPALERILGYEPDERVGKKISDLIHPDDLEHVSRTLGEYIENPGIHKTVEYRVRARDGTWHHFEGIGNNLIDDPSVRGIVVNARDITDRKQAEREVRDSEEKYRTLFETVTQGIVYQNAEGRITSANPAAERILGLSLEQMQGKTSQDPRWRTIREDGSELPGEELPISMALNTGEKVAEVIGVYVPERDEYRWINATAVPQFRPGEDRPYQAYVIFDDVTARKQAEEELQWSERSLSEAQRLAHLGNWHYDVARDRAYWSDELYRIFGLAQQEFTPTYRTFLDFVHPEDKRLVRETVRAAWRGMDQSSVEYRIVRPDGEERFVSTRYESVRDVSGRPSWLVGTIQDITWRKRAEETLRISETRFRTIIEQSPLSIQILSPEGRTLQVNRAWEDLWGVTLEDLGNYNLLDDQQLVDKGIMPYIRRGFAGEPTKIPAVVYDPDESIPELSRHEEPERWVQAFIYPVKDESGNIREVTLIHEDVSGQKQAEEEIRTRARQQAAVADLSRLALAETDLQSLMNEAVEALSRTLEVEYCKVLELLPSGEELLLRAGVGWEEGLVGQATVGAHLDSQAGYTLASGEPVVSEDLGSETRFSGPPLLHGHGVVSGMSVIIRGHERPYGVLGVHATRRRKFSEDDVNFLRAVANVLAAAIERRRAEAGLRESEERFRATFEQAAVGVAHVGFGGEWLRVNGRLCEIVGYTREELLGGMTFQNITHPDDLQKDLDMLGSLVTGEISTYDTEKRYFRKDGSVIWINLTVSAATDREDTPEYFISVIEDITDRKRDEAELERQAELIDLSHDAILVRDIDGTIFSWNRGAEEVYGWSKEEVGGSTKYELLRTPPSVIEEVNATLRLGGRWEGELTHTRRDGTIIEVESRQVLVGEVGSTMVLEINRDITDRKRNEAELERLATFPRLNPAPIIETDVAGNTTYLNPAAEAWFSELADQGSRHPLLADLEQAEAEIRRLGGRPLNREVRVGENFYLQTISRLPESGLLRIYATDVTERRRAEDGLRFLARASDVLSSSLDYHETLASVARLTVPDLADWCAIDVFEDGVLNRLAVVHEDPEKLALARKLRELYPPDPESQVGVPQALREARSVLVPEVTDSMLEGAVRDEEHRELLKGLGLKSYMAVPLIVRGRTLGVITLASDESGPVYGAADLELAEDLARRAAVAVDNARLFDEAQTEISERVEAETALRESQERYRTFIAQSTEGIQRFELEEPIPIDLPEEEQLDHFYRYGYLAECNDAMARMYGYPSAEELIGTRTEDMLPRSVPENVAFLKAGISNGYRVVNAESQEFDRWGNRKYFLNNLTGIIENGRVVRAWGTQRDVTEQRRAEEALRQSEELYRTVVEQAAENIFLVDVETKRILETNDAFRDSLGYEEDEVERLTLYDVVAHDRESVDQNTRHILEEGRRSLGERQYRRRDGSLVDVEVNVSLVSLNYRQAMCIVAHDVTGRKRTEEDLRRSEELYRAVVEQAGEGIFLFDAETKQILETNSAFQLMLGYTSEELGRMKLYDVISEDPESVDRNVQRTLEQNRFLVGERVYRRKDGSAVDVEVSGSMISYRGRDVLCAVARDITERKQTEEALREAREAERNRIARDLHDDILQDIVYALQEANILQTLAGDEAAPELEEIADALKRSVEGLREAIFELRLEDTLKQSFAVSLRLLVELNRRMSRQRYALELEIEEGFPEDIPYKIGREIMRVLQEALNNVRRHAHPRHVWVRLGTDADEVWAEVEDDGVGFDTGIFMGGVGQHSMRQRVVRLGGTLRVESEPGAGTRVSLRVPYSRLIDE